jgi:hypothetical protein
MTGMTINLVKTFTIGEPTCDESTEHYCCFSLTDGTKKACPLSQLQIAILVRARVGEHKPSLYERVATAAQYAISCLPIIGTTSAATGPQTKNAWRKRLVTVTVPSSLNAATILENIFRATTD